MSFFVSFIFYLEKYFEIFREKNMLMQDNIDQHHLWLCECEAQQYPHLLLEELSEIYDNVALKVECVKHIQKISA